MWLRFGIKVESQIQGADACKEKNLDLSSSPATGQLCGPERYKIFAFQDSFNFSALWAFPVGLPK